ncbi:MAG: imidazole glycerol phosphate synthase subunit HisH [Desulfonatronovibrionaceae bacterium]
MLAIVNYNAGNLTSVKRALDYLEIQNLITENIQDLLRAEGIIFPGVGAAGSAMDYLRSSGLDQALAECVENSKPLLGICLGSQIVLDYSPENNTSTLGLIPGECRIFDPDWTDEKGEEINIPHMGWNNVELTAPCPLFTGVDPSAEFYFVHAYYPQPKQEYILGETVYGTKFCSVLGREGLWAMQFHPEKSGRPGLRILANFNSYCRGELYA